MGTVAIVAVLIAVLAWFFWPGDASSAPEDPPRRRPDVDEIELERAEREVQEAPDAENVRDWGPGAGGPPVA